VKRELIREFVEVVGVVDEDTCEVEDEGEHEVDARKIEDEDIPGVEDEETREVEDEDIREVEDEGKELKLDLFCFEDVISTEDLGWLTT
jgi:hypothetical protein